MICNKITCLWKPSTHPSTVSVCSGRFFSFSQFRIWLQNAAVVLSAFVWILKSLYIFYIFCTVWSIWGVRGYISTDENIDFLTPKRSSFLHVSRILSWCEWCAVAYCQPLVRISWLVESGGSSFCVMWGSSLPRSGSNWTTNFLNGTWKRLG